MSEAPDLLWQPSEGRSTAVGQFRSWLREREIVDVADYGALWRWSVQDPGAFWAASAEFTGVRFHDAPTATLGDQRMPGAQWFPGASLNYAEHAVNGGGDDAEAVVFVREDGERDRLTYAQLRAQVGAARAGLVKLGVERGDRVVALAPNCVQTLVAFLAAASLGAIWSSCSPDFGTRAIADRFAQIEPVVFIAVDGHCYNGRRHDIRETVDAVRAEISTLRATVLIDYIGAGGLADSLTWRELLADQVPPQFDAVPFDHPLWVLYSSGTTGLPKGIVQGHGGIVVEHLKALRLQSDIGVGDRFFWFTTTGWMMWNFLIGGLLVGATVVLYDGSPGHPDLSVLWRLAQDEKVTYFGTSAPFVQSCLKKGMAPKDEFDLSALRALGSTGSPLSPEGFTWIVENVGEHVQICSVSGGTDLCTAFVGAAPDRPVWRGELSCAALGAAAAAFDPQGVAVLDEVGELVLTNPMPSMPLYLWNDVDGSKMNEAYFELYPGVWRHGDWVSWSAVRGSAVIHGRSDSTLNRGGVRMGTAEFYRVVEGFDDVADALVIDTSAAGVEGELLCYLVLVPGATLDDVEPKLRSALKVELSPRHVPNRFQLIDEVPRTLNGKKCEVPVKRILAGVEVDKAISRDALANPDALKPFILPAQ